jgi:hypothetical protein
MVHKEVARDLAAFLDSPQAAGLAEPAREEVRRIAATFLTVCYEDLAIAPKLLDGHDLHGALGHVMPARFKRKDPLARHVGAVLEAYLAHLEATQVVRNAFELRQALAATIDEFEETVRTGRNVHQHAPKQDPVVHRAPKLGRNDPCFCGSGKKFKKCHGQGA